MFYVLFFASEQQNLQNMKEVRLLDCEKEKYYNLIVDDEAYDEIVVRNNMVLAQALLNKEQEKENFVKAFRIVQEASSNLQENNTIHRSTKNTEIVASNSNNDTDTELEVPENSKLWTEEATLHLINLCKKYDKDFETSVKKYIWAKIAKELSDKCHQIYNPQQCDSKFKTLKNMYKQIKKHNEQSGSNKRFWKYYDQMHDILFSKPEITPKATCSSKTGLNVGGAPIINVENTCTDNNAGESSTNRTPSSFTSSFIRKRKMGENAAEKTPQREDVTTR